MDHGKTSLVRALTATETDRWKEERERGLTIDIGFALMSLAGPEDQEGDSVDGIGIVDVPGHADFIKNMLAGATGIDALLLVVAADEGPMPQTWEHVAIARLLGVTTGVVALTKVDRVDAEWAGLAKETVHDLLAETHSAWADWPVVPVSVQTGEGIDQLRTAIAQVTAKVKRRREADLFRMPVDRAFTVRGTGTVVTGTVWSGSLAVGDQPVCWPEGARVRVRNLESHGRSAGRVGAGRRCAAALVGAPATTGRGSVLVSDPGWKPCTRLGVWAELLPGSRRSIKHGQRVRFYLGTREVMARARTPKREAMTPGSRFGMVLDLESDLLARVGDRAVIRFYSPLETIGGARVAETDPPHRWEDRAAAWNVLAEGEPAAVLETAVGLAGLRGMATGAAPVNTGLSRQDVERATEELALTEVAGRLFRGTALEEVQELALRATLDLHRQRRRLRRVPREALRAALAERCDEALAEEAIRALVDSEGLKEHGPGIRLADWEPCLQETEQTVLSDLFSAIAGGGLQPPWTAEILSGLDAPRELADDLLAHLREEGRIRTVALGLDLATETLLAFEQRTIEMLSDGRAAPPALFKQEFGLSRKYLIPLLEHLDRRGVTTRTDAGRTLAARAGQ
ncbi:MAG: selenocysteine-specific translation elongation factor [Gemmatimonadetes bacterium]|nr:selenocysteine-specific translation elongation factor [Gemmatimonadota bacterium]